MGGNKELATRSPGIERLPDTVAAYSVVLGNAANQRTLDSLADVPRILDAKEGIVALAHANIKKLGPSILILTRDRLVVASTKNIDEHRIVDPAEWSVDSVRHGMFWGNQARLVGPDHGFELRSLLPTYEGARILAAFGFEIPEERRRALPKGFPRDPGAPPIAGLWELSVYEDRLVDHEGNQLPFNGEVEAMADAAGNIAVTRGRNLAAKGLGTLALGPIGLFFVGNAKERQTDTRELYLLVEGPDWAYTHAFKPELGEALRHFAQQINVAARDYRARVGGDGGDAKEGGGVADLGSQLRELKSLKDEGLLTTKEFNEQKKKLLDG